MIIMRTFDKIPIQTIYGAVIDKMRVDSFDTNMLFNPDFKTKMYLLGYNNEELVGMFILEPFTNVSVKVHGGVLPNQISLSRLFVASCVDWIKDNTSIEHLVSETPSKHLKTANLMGKCGFNHVGTFSKNIKIDGQYYDLIIKEHRIWKD